MTVMCAICFARKSIFGKLVFAQSSQAVHKYQGVKQQGGSGRTIGKPKVCPLCSYSISAHVLVFFYSLWQHLTITLLCLFALHSQKSYQHRVPMWFFYFWFSFPTSLCLAVEYMLEQRPLSFNLQACRVQS